MAKLFLNKSLTRAAGFITLRNALPVIGLASLVSLGLWLSNADNVPRVVMPKDTSQPLFIMQNFTSAFMDDNGLKTRSISASYLMHFEGDIVQMRSPTIKLATQDGDTWYTQADQAKLDPSRTMLLEGNVTIKKINAHQTLEMTTDALIYNFEKNTGATEKPVTLRSSGLKISSIGMRFDLNNAYIELKSDVKGQYDEGSF